MPPMSAQNLMISSAAQDLGLGSQLKQNVDDQLEENRRKALMSKQVNGMGLGGSGFAAQDLFPGMR